jgi:hypothetical protein
MRTVRTKVYKFNELSKPAQHVAMDWWREGETYDWIYDQAWTSIEKFADIFDIKIKAFDYQEMYRSEWRFDMQDDILELSGQRLATYIWNNYKSKLYKGKYYGCVEADKYIQHPRIRSKQLTNKGRLKNWFNPYYSAVTLDHSCVLTGWCYDDSLLEPIYEFLDKPDSRDFKELLQDCLYAVAKDVRAEVEASGEDSNVADTIMANDYEFTKDGRLSI